MRHIPDGVGDLLDRVVNAQTLRAYIRLVLLDRKQPTQDDLDSTIKTLRESSRIVQGPGALTIEGLHNSVLMYGPRIEREEASRNKASPFKYSAGAFLRAVNLLAIKAGMRGSR